MNPDPTFLDIISDPQAVGFLVMLFAAPIVLVIAFIVRIFSRDP